MAPRTGGTAASGGGDGDHPPARLGLPCGAGGPMSPATRALVAAQDAQPPTGPARAPTLASLREGREDLRGGCHRPDQLGAPLERPAAVAEGLVSSTRPSRAASKRWASFRWAGPPSTTTLVRPSCGCHATSPSNSSIRSVPRRCRAPGRERPQNVSSPSASGCPAISRVTPG